MVEFSLLGGLLFHSWGGVYFWVVDVARGFSIQEMRPAPLTIRRGSCGVLPSGTVHYYPERVFAFRGGAGDVTNVTLRRRNSRSRRLETPDFLFGFFGIGARGTEPWVGC